MGRTVIANETVDFLFLKALGGQTGSRKVVGSLLKKMSDQSEAYNFNKVGTAIKSKIEQIPTLSKEGTS